MAHLFVLHLTKNDKSLGSMVFPIFWSWWMPMDKQKLTGKLRAPECKTKVSSPCQSCSHFHTSPAPCPIPVGFHGAAFKSLQHSYNPGPNLWLRVISKSPPSLQIYNLKITKDIQWLNHFWLKFISVLSKLCPVLFICLYVTRIEDKNKSKVGKNKEKEETSKSKKKKKEHSNRNSIIWTRGQK